MPAKSMRMAFANALFCFSQSEKEDDKIARSMSLSSSAFCFAHEPNMYARLIGIREDFSVWMYPWAFAVTKTGRAFVLLFRAICRYFLFHQSIFW